MSRIVCLDYGARRTGVAATDPLQIIVSPVTTVDTSALKDFLRRYLKAESVTKIVIGLPKHKDGTETHLYDDLKLLRSWIEKEFTYLAIDWAEEAFSSSDAKSIILQSGIKKQKRRDKALVDKISAVVILQRYLGHI